jgi:signal transduction histidine kinase
MFQDPTRALLSLSQAAQAASGEHALEELQRALLRILQESAGASYSALLDFREGGWAVLCQSEGEHRTPAELPASVLHAARRALKPVNVGDASAQAPYSEDEVVRARRLRSLLCCPLACQGRWRGLLYLESTIAPGAFSQERQQLIASLATLASLALDNAHLSAQMAEQARLQEASRSELVDRAWHAGMVEIASGILHNLGNALNSITVSSALLREHIQGMPVGSIGQVATLLDRPSEELGQFLTRDEKGQYVPEFLGELHHRLSDTQQLLLMECAAMTAKIEHARSVISTQQTYAKSRIAMRERLRLRELADDALRLCAVGDHFDRRIQREYGEEEPELYERHVIVQILVNLINNARNAVRERPGNDEPLIKLEVQQDAHWTTAAVTDNGVGFDPSVKARLFTYGFTTRAEGHGFGLHSAAVSAQSLGGRLEAHSEGPGQGARFALILPRSLAGAGI